VFPESADLRVRNAVEYLARERIVDPVVLLDPRAPDTHAASARSAWRRSIRRATPRRDRTTNDLFEATEAQRPHRGRGGGYAVRPLFFADALCRHGEADGCVAGCIHTTADVLRAALWLIGAGRRE
jgi:phosphate acetyltransferase